MWGKADETEHLPRFGPGATVVAVQSDRESLTGFVRGENYGWLGASQTLIQGKVKAASTCRRAFIGVRAGVTEGAAKSADFQSISARRPQAATI